MRAFLSCLAFVALSFTLRAAEPVLKPKDVVAFIGGEDMAVAAESGYLEWYLQRALPSGELKLRSLAWEGDTVYAQPRDLNYPTLEQQLEEVGATVVLAQFGEMESAPGQPAPKEFAKAYEALLDRVANGGQRRVILVEPILNKPEDGAPYLQAAEEMAVRRKWLVVKSRLPHAGGALTRDGVHLSERGQQLFAREVAQQLGALPMLDATAAKREGLKQTEVEQGPLGDDGQLLETIRVKNRYWFNYSRPQNWAFLAGDRTSQPSSRDHKDPSKRWFPEEMKEWLPLIAQKEEQMWALAKKPAGK